MDAPLRRIGIWPVAEMPWGTHFCLFYESKDDLIAAAAPYFKAGLESNEFCVWAVSDPLTVKDATDAMRDAVPTLDRALADGRMEILPGREWYLKGNEFDLKRISNGWDEKLESALARGLDGMRASGNAFWLDTEHWHEFNVYERELDAAVADKPMTVLCTYPLSASRAADVLDVARAHQFALVRRKGNWEIIETAVIPVNRHTLTPREREVLTWVAKGKSAWEIGEILHITKRTVDEHVQTAARKLGAANRAQAVAVALLHRLIEP
jgi:DNA-binding CsgD family transcriptional regulator